MSNMSDTFRRAFRRHPAGVVILTAEGRSGPAAMTISSLISVSATPPLVAFSLSAGSRSAAAFLETRSLVIHFPRHADRALAHRCAGGDGDRFGSDIPWERLPTGEPRYTEVGTWFRALLRDRLPVNGATLVTAELVEGAVSDPTEDSGALIYLDRGWHGHGKPPRLPSADDAFHPAHGAGSPR